MDTTERNPASGNQQRARVALLALCGLPGAGKSQLAAKLCTIGHKLISVVHVCFDDFLLEVQTAVATFDPALWHASRQQAFEHVRYLVLRCLQANDSKMMLIILDDNLYYRSMRQECYKLARDHGCAYMQLYISCPVQLAKQRNRQRCATHIVPDDVIDRMAAAFEQPQPDRFEFEKCTIQFDTAEHANELDIGSVFEQIWAVWGPAPSKPVSEEELQKQRQAGQIANLASLLHGLDLRTRKALSECIECLPADRKATAARALNDARKKLLQQARNLVTGHDAGGQKPVAEHQTGGHKLVAGHVAGAHTPVTEHHQAGSQMSVTIHKAGSQNLSKGHHTAGLVHVELTTEQQLRELELAFTQRCVQTALGTPSAGTAATSDV